MLTRWQKFYTNDPKLGSIAPSQCAGEAARLFAAAGKKQILDLACGAGRDTRVLLSSGAVIIGVDAAFLD
ncbi:MAG TPA: class I SAM-dependent methyltransferase [Anaerolineaceae bacterium]|nr:class I SAM-dependent methyltransferase [Anaerolineaceae bacterium]HPN50264.1 class I SAM-dependent methyltransferase [Anaerolineaceae bacterium]